MSKENSPVEPIVAAFDFDGTITFHDSLVPFLFFVFGKKRALAGLTVLLPWFIGCGLGFISRDKTKERVFTYFLKGMPLQELKERGIEFSMLHLMKKIRPGAINLIEWHKQQGHRLILISASIDVYLEPWAKAMGFDHLLSSKLEIDAEGLATGKFFGKNCRGPEKTKKLGELLGSKTHYVLYAYGDSKGDKELLALADYPYYRNIPKHDDLPRDE